VITADRFIASKLYSKDSWLEARRAGVTATQVSKAASGPGGFEQAVSDYRADWVEPDNAYMAFGRRWEGPLAQVLKDRFGVMANDWLIAHDENRRHLATPDGLSLNHSVISEIKTTGKDWNPEKIPIQYRRQVQWQLYVTGAARCVFAWMLREERDGQFLPAWWEPKIVLFDRDDDMIGELLVVADRLLERVDGEKIHY
jgi:predicted phage-related endonuclease